MYDIVLPNSKLMLKYFREKIWKYIYLYKKN